MKLIKWVDISIRIRFIDSAPWREVIVVVKGVNSVSSSGYTGALGSLPGNQTAKREHPKGLYEDPNAAKAFTRERLYNILQALHSYSEAAQRGLKFHIHEDTGQIFVQVIAKEDGRVIREIPSEELLDLETRIDEMTGVLFSKDV
jgi:flagellar protein FlaG